MRKTIISGALAVLALFLSPGIADACTCLDTSGPCPAYQGTPVVFVGMVKSIDEEKAEILRFGKKETIRTSLVAHFLVEEPLKDIGAGEVDVVTGGGGGDCGYNFKAGERYLVYAHKSVGGALGDSMSRTVLAPSKKKVKGDVLSASICSRTRRLADAQDDVELLRAFISGKPQTRIFGAVSELARLLGTYEYNIDYVGPIAGLRVTAEGAQGTFDTQTDKEGRYRFADLAPGKYKVGVQLPEGYGPLFDFSGTVAQVELTLADCGAELDFDGQVDGRVGGRVFDSQGQLADGSVQVSIVTLESADQNFALAKSRSDYSKKGRYEIGGLPPGRYVLGVSIADPPEKGCPYPPTYFPSGHELKQATIIELKLGQKLTDYDIHLPPPLELVTLTGIVLHANGKPAVGADVDLYDSGDPGYALGFGVDVTTDSSGRFSIQALRGRRYLLHAYIQKDYFEGTGIQSEPVGVDTNGPTPLVRLVLTKPGIFPPGAR